MKELYKTLQLLFTPSFWAKCWWVAVFPFLAYWAGSRSTAIGMSLFFIVYFILILPLLESRWRRKRQEEAEK